MALRIRWSYCSGQGGVFSGAGGSQSAAGDPGARGSRAISSYMGGRHPCPGDLGGIGTRGEYRDFDGSRVYLDLVEDAEVGSMMNEGVSLGPLIFWALLSLSAVVANSWGQATLSTVSGPEVVAQQATASPVWVPPIRRMPGPPAVPPGVVMVPSLPSGGAPLPQPASSAAVVRPQAQVAQPQSGPPPIMVVPPPGGVALNPYPPPELRSAPNIRMGAQPTPNPPLVPGSPGYVAPGVIPNQPPN